MFDVCIFEGEWRLGIIAGRERSRTTRGGDLGPGPYVTAGPRVALLPRQDAPPDVCLGSACLPRHVAALASSHMEDLKCATPSLRFHMWSGPLQVCKI